MSQSPDPHKRPGAPGQPPWASYPTTAYPPHAGRGTPSSGHGPPRKPPSRGRRTRLRKRDAILLTLAAFLVIGVIASALQGGAAKVPTAATSSAAALKAPSPLSLHPSAAANALTKAEHSCGNRKPASGDIYVRMVTPGNSPQSQRLGGEWSWDHRTNKCLTSVQMMVATAPLTAGHCTQVGYVADNPGYDPDASPAAPLTRVAAQAGPACQHAATPPPARVTSAPAQATSAAPPAPATTPASTAATTPAGCTPLSNEGTCYEPGEYCRNVDHGASGVAGDGEAITCEDNDGWRWEPA